MAITLANQLKENGIDVWRDKDKIMPGERWKKMIKKAISEGSFFIACFSKEYSERTRTYMNEELTLAIEELRMRSTDKAWFIPVLLTPCELPDIEIGGGQSLRDLNWVSLYEGWDKGVELILATMRRAEPRMLYTALGESSLSKADRKFIEQEIEERFQRWCRSTSSSHIPLVAGEAKVAIAEAVLLEMISKAKAAEDTLQHWKEKRSNYWNSAYS
jgi:hypothetical protein